ncbi:hypothetical protein N9M53_05130, partial [Alphaproteobacteria bacterium]|nr:hypothetical protein [Alphaproteobacteria bacterium]
IAIRGAVSGSVDRGWRGRRSHIAPNTMVVLLSANLLLILGNIKMILMTTEFGLIFTGQSEAFMRYSSNCDE